MHSEEFTEQFQDFTKKIEFLVNFPLFWETDPSDPNKKTPKPASMALIQRASDIAITQMIADTLGLDSISREAMMKIMVLDYQRAVKMEAEYKG